MQTICTSLQIDNHATNTSSLNIYRLDSLPDAQPTVSEQYNIQYGKVEFIYWKSGVKLCKRLI